MPASDTAEPKRRSRYRTALIDATKQLLSKNAVNGFSIDDVVSQAEVARGTFYNHFSSLDELVAVTFSSVQEEVIAAIGLAYASGGDAPTRVARGVVSSMLYSYRNPTSAPVLQRTPMGIWGPTLPRNQILSQPLQEGLAAGDFKFPNLEAAFACVVGSCEAANRRLLEVIHEYSLVRELVLGVCVIVLRALAVDSRRIDKIAREALRDCFDGPLGR